MPKLLIVDDNENNRIVLSDALDTGEYDLFEATDGLETLSHVEKDPPDLILLDVEMPNLDGIETLKRLKADESTEHIPVIMVTALNTESQISACLDLGAVDHVVKPYSSVIIRARVRSALRSQSRKTNSSADEHVRGRVITFMGAKGGSGTTTLALNMAACVAHQNKNVVAAELRPDYGTAIGQLGTSPALNLQVLLDEKSGKLTRQKLRDCLVTHPSGMRVLLSPQTGEKLVNITPKNAEMIVSGLSDASELTIIDLPAAPWEYSSTVLRQSDYVVLTVELEPSSLAAAQKRIERLKTLGIGEVATGVVVVNRAVYGAPLTLNDVRAGLDCKLVGVVPLDPDACLMAMRAGSPVVLARPESAIAGSYSSLANRLTEGQVAELYL